MMWKRQTTGSIVCPSCGKLVGVTESECWHCGRSNPGMWGFGPALRRLGADLGVSQIVIYGCVSLFVLSLILGPESVGLTPDLGFLSPGGESLERLGSAGVAPVVGAGRWWTVLSAGWLHGSLLHILFNMMWVRQLAPAASMIFGPARTMLIYLLASVGGFILTSGMGWVLFLGINDGSLLAAIVARIMGLAGHSVGASAAVFGLLGAVIYAGRRGVAAQLGRQAWIWAIFLFVFGLIFPGVDNWAHLGGFVAGYGLAHWFNPLTRERVDHIYWALGGLAATVLAVVASFLSGI